VAVEPESEFLASMDANRWPIGADGAVFALAVWDPEGLVPQRASRAKSVDEAKVPPALDGRFYDLFEDVCKMRNFIEAGEATMARFMAPHVAYAAAVTLGLLNRQHFNGSRDLATRPRDFDTLPPYFWEDYLPLLGATGSSEELVTHALRLLAEIRSLWSAARGGDPEPLNLEEKLSRGACPRE